MTTNPLGCRMSYDISTEFEWIGQVATHTEGIVNNQWDASLVANLTDGGDIWNIELWVSDCLHIYSPSILVDCFLDLLGILALDKLAPEQMWSISTPSSTLQLCYTPNVELLEVYTELIVCSSIQIER